MTDAWLAGLFEGEGTIHLPKKRGQVQVSIEMNDQDVVKRAHEAAGVGTARPSRGGRMWTWKVSNGADSITVLKRLLPWLGERRAMRARDAIARWEYYVQKRDTLIHGSYATFQRELARGMTPCSECTAARKAYNHERYLARRGG